VPSTSAQIGEDETALALARAEVRVVSAYQAVLNAEKTGANVSGLLAQLNDVGKLLAEAKVAYRLGDYDGAVRLTGFCSEISERVKNEADRLQSEAHGHRIMSHWLIMTSSLVGTVAVGLGSFWSWRFFKSRYYERVLRMKPEVSFDES